MGPGFLLLQEATSEAQFYTRGDLLMLYFITKSGKHENHCEDSGDENESCLVTTGFFINTQCFEPLG